MKTLLCVLACAVCGGVLAFPVVKPLADTFGKLAQVQKLSR